MSKISLAFVLAGKADNIHTQTIMPAWNQLVKQMSDKIQFVYIDYDDCVKVREQYQIVAFPSYHVFRNGVKTVEYPGERDLNSMARFVNRITGPSMTILDNARDANDFIEDARKSVIYAGDDQSILDIFKEVAENLSDYAQFAHAVDSDAIIQLGIEETPSIQLHRMDDRADVKYEMAFQITFEQLREWVLNNLVPKYSMKDGITFRDLTHIPRYTFLAIVDSTRPKSVNTVHNVLTKLVEEQGDNFSFVYCDLFDFGQNALYLGFTGAKEPMFCILFFGQNGQITEKYLFSERREPTPQNLCKWVNDFNAGKVQPKVRGEPIPKTETNGSQKIVAANFRQKTKDPENDVVVLIHNNQYESSKELFELIDKAAKVFQKQGIDTVKFYHINQAKNELFGLSIPPDTQMPIVIFYPAGDDKQPMKLPDDLTPETLIDIILTHAKSKINFEFTEQTEEEGSLEL